MSAVPPESAQESDAVPGSSHDETRTAQKKRKFKRGKDRCQRRRRTYEELDADETEVCVCPVPGCNRQYVAKHGPFNLRTHMIQKHPDHARDWPLEALAALRESPRLRTCASLSDSAEGGQHSGLLLVHPPTSNSRLVTSQPQLPGMIAQTTPIFEEHQTYGTHSSWDMAHLVPQPRPVNEQGFTHQGIVIAPEGQPMTYPGTMMNDFAHQGTVFAPPHLAGPGSGNAEQGFSQAAVLADLLRRSAELELGPFVQPQATQYVDQLETVTHLPPAPWHHDGPGLGPLDRLPGRGPYASDSMSMPGLAADPGRGLVDVHPANFPYFAITGVPWPDRATGILTSRPRRYPWLGSGGNYEAR